ncbi:hypothetical protein WN55_06476 [Dufourea novaeangliae]|uniref:Uncharacterized protein n=1 Tax=Dufourea novaeangliae TaxID=178035 RepID=A0A154PQ66_DUFNO|nr:hypothetical protein WN55_06476 [Dufourea novaeangliae]
MLFRHQKFIEEQSRTKGKEYFQFHYKNNSKLWFANTSLTHEIIVIINRCRSDHCNLAVSLSRIGIINEAKYNCNYEKQHLNHIVWQCPMYDTQRLKLIKKLNKCQLFLPQNTRSLLSQPNIAAFSHVYHFLRKCNLKYEHVRCALPSPHDTRSYVIFQFSPHTLQHFPVDGHQRSGNVAPKFIQCMHAAIFKFEMFSFVT